MTKVKFEAFSSSATLPGKEIIIYIMPFDPAHKAGVVRALAGQIKSKAQMRC
jgi:hypothetical protein